MSSESEATEFQSVLERLITSRTRDLSLFIPFLLGFSGPEDHHNSSDHDSSIPDGDRIILINPLTQGMVVIEGTGLDAFFRNLPRKDGPPPASKSSIEAMPSVDIGEGECVICLEEWMAGAGIIVKEMPCKHRFHGDCIEKWLRLHGSCPVCRHTMPVEEEEDGGKKQGEERGDEGRERRREIWVRFSFGSHRRRLEETVGGANQLDTGDQSENHTEMGS